jgi:phosphoglycerol transferase MdoB-like AlkP superfamily enzyme
VIKRMCLLFVRRGAASLLVAVAMFLTTPSTFAQAVSAPRRPNIILIMADDLGWGDVAYNGNTQGKTPALDQLAREGIRLDRFYAGGRFAHPPGLPA